jgi:hypothetical protein
MKKAILVVAAVVIFAPMLMRAGDKSQTGTIVSESSVPCGSKEQGSKHTELLCQEYVIRSATTDYHVRQMKSEEKELIPINTPIEFTLDKDRMKLKANGKSFEYIIVAETAAEAGAKLSFR